MCGITTTMKFRFNWNCCFCCCWYDIEKL